MTGTLQGGGFFKFLITLSICCTCLFTNAQAIDQPGETITLKADNIPLYEVFKTIFKQTKFKVSYANSILDDRQRVSVNFDKTTIAEAMDVLLKDKNAQWIVNDKVIIVSPKREMNVIKKSIYDSSIVIPSIKGKVTDALGNPIPGATVLVKNSSDGATTDVNGEFTLGKTKKNDILLISSIGYETREIIVKGNSILAQLNVVVNELDETVVIAYGTTTKRFNTGNVGTVKADDIARQPVNNPLLALQGRVPGLFITQAKGLSGSAVTVRIQGQNSIRMGSDPLYIIDGVPYTSQLLPSFGGVLGTGLALNGRGYFGNPLSYINPNDIESIEILKDGDATAIYGSRAANGAILITTKSGKPGQTKIDINLQSGWGEVTRKLDLMSTDQYLQMRREALKNDGLNPSSGDYDVNGTWSTSRYTDWQKILIGGTAKYTNINAGISGGNANIQYLVSSTYHRETTVFPGEFSDTKGSVNLSINTISKDQKFRFKMSANYMIDNNKTPDSDITSSALQLPPNAPSLYNSDGSLNWEPTASGASTWTNPISYLYNKYTNKTNNLISNAVLSYRIFSDLEVSGNLGYTSLQSSETDVFPLIANRPEYRATSSRFGLYANNDINTWIIEPQVNYKRTFGDVRVEALVGMTIQQNNSKGEQLYGQGYNSDEVIEDIGSAASIGLNSPSIHWIYKYNALFGRLNFNWREKYIVNFTGRRDGSSRFGSANQFHNFGAVGIAWLFSKEIFVQNSLPFISFGKIRASYGTSGNDQIGDYQFLSQYAPSGAQVAYQGATGLLPTGLSNPYLQWEETRKLQFGLEIGLFKDRAFANAGYYRNTSSNQLMPYALPLIAGFDAIIRNFPATVQNTGWEFSFNTTNVKNAGFSWTTNINLTIPRNKLTSFPNLSTSSYANSLVIGQPITLAKLYRSLGVNPATGEYQFADTHGNPTASPDVFTDRTVLINTSPTIFGGLQNNFAFKGFELDVLFQFVRQKDANYSLGYIPGNYGINQPLSLLDRWQKPGDMASHQRYNSNSSIIGTWYKALESDAAYSDASYVRLKNLSLSWQVPDQLRQRLNLQSLRLYVQGQNLLTISNYIGLDPETRSSTSLPPLRLVTIGIQVVL